MLGPNSNTLILYEKTFNFKQVHCKLGAHGGAVVEALRYKPEGSGIDSRWFH
jgi:hypothetical protein